MQGILQNAVSCTCLVCKAHYYKPLVRLFGDLKIIHSQLTHGTKLSHTTPASGRYLHNLSALIQQLLLGLRHTKMLCLIPNFTCVCVYRQ